MMGDGQRTMAFMAALIGQGVSPEQIARAVDAVADLRLGYSICKLAEPVQPDHALVLAFVDQQQRRLAQT